MTERLRAVFDTNVFVSALLSRNPKSPTQELIWRWQNDEFTLLVCEALLVEVVEKLRSHRVDEDEIKSLLVAIGRLAEWVDVPKEAVTSVILRDPDDDVILACAVVGKADYLVSYDPHFDILGGSRLGIKITKALPFLWAIRGDLPPKPSSVP